MNKVNRRLILLIILVLIMGISVGCSKTPKAPEGVSQEFYDDMIFISKDMIKTVRNMKDPDPSNGDLKQSEGRDRLLDYKYELIDSLTLTEKTIVEELYEIYFLLSLHTNEIYKDEEITEAVETFSNLMEIEFDVDKILLK